MRIIISGFAGIGKTTLQKKFPNVIDLESSDYKWVYDDSNTESLDKEQRKGVTNRKQNPLWPINYVEEIIKKSLEYDIVLISQDLDMRNALKDSGAKYYVCFPKKECKDDFIKRYKDRGNNERFISLVSENFEKWIDALMIEDNKLIMEPGEYLEDTLVRYQMINQNPEIGFQKKID